MMTERRTGWRKVCAVASLSVALLVPASTALAQAQPTPRPATQPTPRPATSPAVTTQPRSGEPIQDASMAAMLLGAMLVGGFALRRRAERRG